MTNNIDRAAEVIEGYYPPCQTCRARATVGIPEVGECDECAKECRIIAQALVDDGLLTPDLPEPIINDDDGNYEWHADEYTVDVDRGIVSLWTPDGTHWKQTPNQARNLANILNAAADHAEGVGRADA